MFLFWLHHFYNKKCWMQSVRASAVQTMLTWKKSNGTVLCFLHFPVSSFSVFRTTPFYVSKPLPSLFVLLHKLLPSLCFRLKKTIEAPSFPLCAFDLRRPLKPRSPISVYLAPEYLLKGRATEKTDVFSYGAVVLEVASGKRPIETGVGRVGASSNLVEWVWSLHKEGRLLTVANARLGGEFDEREKRRVLLVGLSCSHPDPLARPTMRGMIQMPVGEAEVPIVPRAKPSTSFSTSYLLMSLQDSVSDCNALITMSTSSSEDGFIGGNIV